MKARVCEVCGRPKGVTFHAMQTVGRMRSVCAHTPCFKRLREKTERERLAAAKEKK